MLEIILQLDWEYNVVREWVEWVKHNLHIYTAPLPPSLSSEVQTSKNFLFLLKVRGARNF